MNIGIFGTGGVARTLAGKLSQLGHGVVLGTRDVETTRAREAVAAFLAAHPSVRLAPFAEAAAHGELLVNATAGVAALDALALAGPLDGKVLLDLSNPLDFSRGFPPRLAVCNDDSLSELIQRAVPSVRVVKALNTVGSALMVEPGKLAGGDHTVFVCGDDREAKALVTRLLIEEFGWSDVIDLGGLAAARGTEMYLALWTRLYGALGTANFSIKVVR